MNKKLLNKKRKQDSDEEQELSGSVEDINTIKKQKNNDDDIIVGKDEITIAVKVFIKLAQQQEKNQYQKIQRSNTHRYKRIFQHR